MQGLSSKYLQVATEKRLGPPLASVLKVKTVFETSAHPEVVHVNFVPQFKLFHEKQLLDLLSGDIFSIERALGCLLFWR